MSRERDPTTPGLADIIRPGDRIVWGQGCAEPTTLAAALMAERNEIGDISAFIGASFSANLDPGFADRIAFTSYCATGANRHLAAAGKLALLPTPYSHLPELLAEQVDVLMLQLAPPDGNGVYSLGLAHDYVAPLIDAARIVIGEINDRTPWTHGERTLRDTDIDYVVRTSAPLPEVSTGAPGEAGQAIANHVAGLVEDGSVLQAGLGALPASVLSALSRHRDLGIHSGAFVDTMVDLIESGAVTNAQKSIDPGQSVVGVMLGSERSFRFVERNKDVSFRSTTYTHNPDVLASIDRFVAINSALEVDLTGQINAEVARGRYVGAVGGGPEFLRGAARSKGGLPIVVLPATVKQGDETVSTIVDRLNGPVSTARSDAGLIVTEYGVADLRGQSLAERRKRMIAIADPRFRETLERSEA